MAEFDTADLVSRCQLYRRRPSTDEATTTPNWYTMLSDAERHWKRIIAAHYPKQMYGAPQALTSSDGGYTYTFPSSEQSPLAVLVLSSPTGTVLNPGPYWSSEHDYVLESGQIRMTLGRARTFADGPYARFVTAPAAITESVTSTIKPVELRQIIVYHACALDAMRGGMDDPAPYEKMAQWAAWGNPNLPGDVGMIGALKAQDTMGGLAARAGGSGFKYWRPNG